MRSDEIREVINDIHEWNSLVCTSSRLCRIVINLDCERCRERCNIPLIMTPSHFLLFSNGPPLPAALPTTAFFSNFDNGAFFLILKIGMHSYDIAGDFRSVEIPSISSCCGARPFHITCRTNHPRYSSLVVFLSGTYFQKVLPSPHISQYSCKISAWIKVFRRPESQIRSYASEDTRDESNVYLVRFVYNLRRFDLHVLGLWQIAGDARYKSHI